MPTVNISWSGDDRGSNDIKELETILRECMAQDITEFGIIASHWGTCLESEKVILCRGRAYMGKVKNELLVVVPDSALSIQRLLWMWEAEIVCVDDLGIEHIKRAMAL